MPLTSARIRDGLDVWGMHGVAIRDFTGDSSYPAGGYPLVGTNFGFGNKPLDGVIPIGGNAASAGFRFAYDNVNRKLVVGSSLGAGTTTYSQADIKGSAATNSENADAAAAPTNGLLIDTGSAVAAGAWTFSKAVDPDISRNLVITIENPTGGGLDLFEGVTSFVIVGTFRGAAQTDTVTFTSTAGNKTVATTKFRYKYGTKPFSTVTSVVMTNAPANDLVIGVGIGSLLGLPQPANPNAESSIIKLTKNAANLSPTGLYSTNGTVNFGVLANGDDISVEYLTGGQVSDGTDLSGVVVRLLGICRGT